MSATPSKAPDAAHDKEKAAEGAETKKDDAVAKAAAETRAKVEEAAKHKSAKETLEELKKAPDAAKKKEIIEGLHLSVEEAKKDDVKKEFKDAVKGDKALEDLVEKKFHDAAHAKKDEKHGKDHDKAHGKDAAHGADHGHGHDTTHGDAHGHDATHAHATPPPKVSYGVSKLPPKAAANDNKEKEDETAPPGWFKSLTLPLAVPAKTVWQAAKGLGALGLGMVFGKWFTNNYNGPDVVKPKPPVNEPKEKSASAAHGPAHGADHGKDDHAAEGGHDEHKDDHGKDAAHADAAHH